jgi:hypothetical protein
MQGRVRAHSVNLPANASYRPVNASYCHPAPTDANPCHAFYGRLRTAARVEHGTQLLDCCDEVVTRWLTANLTRRHFVSFSHGDSSPFSSSPPGPRGPCLALVALRATARSALTRTVSQGRSRLKTARDGLRP